MAKLVLCGLESNPKLNGRDVKLMQYHATRGRWEVELLGDLPMVDLFRVEWDDSWYERDGKYDFGSDKPVKTFKEVLEERLKQHKVFDIRTNLIILDTKEMPISLFESDGALIPAIAGKYIVRRAGLGEVSRESFPLYVRKLPEGSKTLGVRPCCLRIREDDYVDKMRARKVEMSVGVMHSKPQLNDQFAELGRFQASSMQWAVRPDIRSLWDVRVDGEACPVLLHSDQVCDESSGNHLSDPICVRRWERAECGRSGNALYAAVSFKRGQIILEEEPVLSALGGARFDPARLWQQFTRLPSDKQEAVLELTTGADHLWQVTAQEQQRSDRSHGQRKKFGFESVIDTSTEFRNRSKSEREQAWHLCRIFDNNCFKNTNTNELCLCILLSKVNHSCNPNAILADLNPDTSGENNPAFRLADPFKKVLIAQRDIAEGEEIAISYISEDDLLEPVLRRRHHFVQWAPKCLCERCLDEESDGLLRRFCCTGGTSCGGTHSASLMGLLPCSACGVEVADGDQLLCEEEIHVSAFTDVLECLSSDSSMFMPDRFVHIVEGAMHSGLATSHWLVCKARAILAKCYQTNRKPALAMENIKPILNLQERVLNYQSSQRLEVLADLLMELGQCAEAFEKYASVLGAFKLMSPELIAGQSIRCDNLRSKLRQAIEGKAKQPDEK